MVGQAAPRKFEADLGSSPVVFGNVVHGVLARVSDIAHDFSMGCHSRINSFRPLRSTRTRTGPTGRFVGKWEPDASGRARSLPN
jgi:hypothetical protein